MKEKSSILDEWLVLKVQQGDQEAFRQLVLKWHKKLLYQSHIRTNDWSQSEDIVQDTWQWLVGNMHKLREVSKFGSWIRTIIDRRSIDWVRKQQRQRENQNKLIDGLDQTNFTSHTNDTADHSDVYEKQLSTMEAALNGLNPESKLILVLYYLENHSIQSIAEILSIPSGTVKSRLFHAREKLKKKMKNL